MGRLAGDKPQYPFRIVDPRGKATEYGFDLISSTTVVKAVLGGASGGMRYSGFKLGLQAAAILEHDIVLEGVDLDEVYEAAKKTAFDPNRNMRSAGDRGNAAHKLLEDLVNGDAKLDPEGDELFVVRPLPIKPDPGEVIGSGRTKLERYELAVGRWWLENQDAGTYTAERPLWNLTARYCGTADLILENAVTDERIILDLKTHKPNRGKDGPAFDDDRLQLDSYALAHEDMGLGTVDHTVVLLATESGEMLEDHRNLPRGSFLTLLKLYVAMKGG